MNKDHELLLSWAKEKSWYREDETLHRTVARILDEPVHEAMASWGSLRTVANARYFHGSKSSDDPDEMDLIELFVEVCARYGAFNSFNAFLRARFFQEWGAKKWYNTQDWASGYLLYTEALRHISEDFKTITFTEAKSRGDDPEVLKAWYLRYQRLCLGKLGGRVPSFTVQEIPYIDEAIEKAILYHLLKDVVGAEDRMIATPDEIQQLGHVLVTIPFKATHGEGLADLKLVVDAIKGQTYTDKISVHVSDGSKNPAAQLFCEDEDLSYSHLPVEDFDANKLRNAGPRLVDADWLLWLDQDMVIHPQYLSYGLTYLKQVGGPKYGGKMVYSVTRAFAADRSEMGDWLNRHYDWKECSKFTGEIPWPAAMANNLLMSKKVYEKVGEFWEQMKYWGHEDLEWAYRAKLRDVKLYRCDLQLVLHLPHSHEVVQDEHMFFNRMLFYQRHKDSMTEKDKKVVVPQKIKK